MIDKADLERMNEADLRQQVLMPLFTRMGFRDVFEYHGGTGEQGKDIVMWMPNPLGERENYAVVVKAGKVTGRARGASSANDVEFQINQSLNSRYTDPVSGDRHRVHRCWVVASGTLGKQAVDAIIAALNPQIQRAVQFVGGEKLWALVEEHLGQRLILQRLQEAAVALEQATQHHRIVAEIRGGNVAFGIEPKHPNADLIEPLTVGLKWAIPDTNDGAETRSALDRHRRTGAGARIPSDFVTVDWPPPLRPFFGDHPVSVGLKSGGRIIRASAIVSLGDQELARLDGIELRVVQAGEEEITLTNADQRLPWFLTLIWNRLAKRTQLQFVARQMGASAKRLLEAARFASAFSSPNCTLTIEDADTGLWLLSGPRPALNMDEPDEHYLQLLERLVIIGRRCGTPVSVPDRDLAPDEISAVNMLWQAVQHGSVATRVSGVDLAVRPGRAGDFLSVIEEKPTTTMRILAHDTATLFGVELDLGQVVRVIEGMRLSADDTERLRHAGDPATAVHVRLAAEPDGGRMTTLYLQWLNEEQRQSVERQLGSATDGHET